MFRIARCFLLPAVLPALLSAAAVWTGEGGGDFVQGANWKGGVAPANSISSVTGDVVRFPAGADASMPRLSTARSVNGLVFGEGTWTFGGDGV